MAKFGHILLFKGRSKLIDGKNLSVGCPLVIEIEEVFDGVPSYLISAETLKNGLDIVELLATETDIMSSNGEARRSLKENAISINKEKVGLEYQVNTSDVLASGYILAQKGKKNYFLVKVN